MTYTPYQNAYSYAPLATPQQRLYNLEQQYPQFAQSFQQPQFAQPLPQQMQSMPVQPQPQQQMQGSTSQSPVMSVTNEQEARDYPLDLSGALMMFVMKDDSKIFAKRFNTSNAKEEFAAYVKAAETAPQAEVASQDNIFLLGIVNDFTSKLETMYTEIQALRKDVQQHGNQLGSDSKAYNRPKSTNATNNAKNTGDGTGGGQS